MKWQNIYSGILILTSCGMFGPRHFPHARTKVYLPAYGKDVFVTISDDFKILKAKSLVSSDFFFTQSCSWKWRIFFRIGMGLWTSIAQKESKATLGNKFINPNASESQTFQINQINQINQESGSQFQDLMWN